MTPVAAGSWVAAVGTGPCNAWDKNRLQGAQSLEHRQAPQVSHSVLLSTECQQYTNRSCEECLKNVTCLWCASSRRCVPYPVRRILPSADLCELRSARWGVCWVNFEALIIAMSVVGGMILVMLVVCCCCCCKKKSKKPDKEDERAARERERRRVRQEERRAEMKSRHDEIRRKYGLFKEENPYAKFEN
ncbi:pituitary tumor-transforming gene 1 protein-interacting protein [Meleagris gallopavo]|uniref:pituitary tumor-transforming gene 1 protein-interacting protein n=1 Tax=Meleagris gallopavo TaxID=9103 RepID=UPI0012ABB794|nr:pituitary tumor-transforming gene 1 protein-interacting protein [Meleagris gallopavo]